MTGELSTGPAPEGVLGLQGVRARMRHWRQQAQTIAFVPTMGALHEGHLSLVDVAHAHADRVIASVFVNPKQFAPGEDYTAYPRTLKADAGLLVDRGCHLIYAPQPSDMYPEGFATTVQVAGPAAGLESVARPDFFAGVATVVTKLLNAVRPDIAVFGEKDYQQLLVVKRLVADLDLDVTIASAATVREADGLAMSSRNTRLGNDHRRIAPSLYATLRHAEGALHAGVPVRDVEARAGDALVRAGFDGVDYVALRDADTLAPVAAPGGRPMRLLAAARLGDVRLIDNIPVKPVGVSP